MNDSRMSYFDIRKNKEIPEIANSHIISALELKYSNILDDGALKKNDAIFRKEKQNGKYIISSDSGAVMATIQYSDGVINQYWLISRPSKNETIQRSVLNGKVSFKKQKKQKKQ